jgi:DNA adenine methylase
MASCFKSFLEESGGYFVEPFAGSSAMLLAVQPERAVLGDVLEPLMEFYSVVRDDPGGLAWNLSSLAILGVDKESYLRVRDMRPETPVGRAARFFFLNRTSFNGLYRENKNGDFNVPWGDATYRKSIIGRSARDAIESLFPNREKIQQVSDALKRVEVLHAGDFSVLIDAAGAGDLIYVDSPYSGTFANYASGGFGPADQERLAEALYLATERGAVVVAHNALTDQVKYLYLEWCGIIEVNEKRSIAANGSRRQPAPCAVMISHNAPNGFVGKVWKALGDRAVVNS